jgi:hypothetical protein
MIMTFSECELFLQIVGTCLTIHLQLSVKIICQVFIHLNNKDLDYEAA